MNFVQKYEIFIVLLWATNLFSAATVNTSSQSPIVYRVNVGGEQWLDSQGRAWLADQRYSPGNFGYMGICATSRSGDPISGTSDEVIYQSDRYDLFGYRFDVPNGHYKIILHFAEYEMNSPNHRVMDIMIENKPVYENLDIFSRVGKNTALAIEFNTKELDIPILDERIDIKLKSIEGRTKLSAIEILQLIDTSAILHIEPQHIDFMNDKNTIPIKISNLGQAKTTCTIQENLPAWLTLQPSSGITVLPQQETIIRATVNREVLKGGIHQDSIKISAPGYEQIITVSVTVTGAAQLTIQTPNLDFGQKLRNMACILKNDGGASLEWSVDLKNLPSCITRIYPSSGILDIEQQQFLNITINRNKLSNTTETHSLPIHYNATTIQLILKVSAPVTMIKHIFVKSDAAGIQDGQSWDNAFIRIGDAIELVKRNKGKAEIWVAEGIYYEHDLYLSPGVELYGGFRGDETYREERLDTWYHPTVVDAQRRGRCFECEHGTVIDGFVIQNGMDWGDGNGKGAGILAYEGDIKIRNNLIQNNVDSWAGALSVDGYELRKRVASQSPLIEYNVIVDNFSNTCAGGIEVWGTKAIIRNNTIVNNYGYGLEINDTVGPFTEIHYGNFYNNIIANNGRKNAGDVWAEAKKSTNYCYVGNQWQREGHWPPYDYCTGNIFGDVTRLEVNFVDDEHKDFHLKAVSPCIDTGDPSSANDADGSRADMGAFPYDKKQTEIQLSPEPLNFGSLLDVHYVTVSAYGGSGAEWRLLMESPLSDALSAVPNSGFLNNGEKERIKLKLKRNAVAEGIFSGFIAVVTPEQSVEKKVSFITNQSKPEIRTNPSSIKVEAVYHHESPAPELIKLINISIEKYDWRAALKYNSDWVRLNSVSGSSNEPLQVSFNTSALKVGDYYDEIILSSNIAINKSISVPVVLTIKPEKYIYEIEVEQNSAVANGGWRVQKNEGSMSLCAAKESYELQDENSRLEYDFVVPDEIGMVYLFAEVDINDSEHDYSYWLKVNENNGMSLWKFNTQSDGWQRWWVNDFHRDLKHMYEVLPGKNKITLYPRQQGSYINWIVITNDPDIDISSYPFGRYLSPK